MEDATQMLFKPVQFASLIAKNRVVMAPMVTNFATEDDAVTDRQVIYYAERARGGVGTIVLEASNIREDVRISARQIGSYNDRFIPGMARLAQSIRAEGAISILQLCHGGPKIFPASGSQTVSVSAVGVRVDDVPRVLSVAELGQVRRDFVASAGRARKAGFDGVEIHAAHFYLLSAAISGFTNKRTDEYGGSLENRVRLTREIVEEIKKEHGADFAVWVRMHGFERLEQGLSLEEALQVASILADAGADAIHVSAYSIPIGPAHKGKLSIPVGAAPLKDTPPGPFLDYAAAIKRAVSVPVIAVGKLDDPELAESALIDGKCDMVALGRQHFCDPYWTRKIAEGKAGEIVHCKYCMTCHIAQQNGKDVKCATNRNLCGAPVYKQDEAS
jgi:2,4-dienoyl-CoA reductase-like NADH-dependent reductase (Old Yellow Enzyme family)